MRDRYFKIVDTETGASYGRYRGLSPKQATTKCARHVFNKSNISVGDLNITIYECTRGSRHKMYTYHAQKINLPEPVVVHIGGHFGGHTITYKYKITLNRIKNPEEPVVVKEQDDQPMELFVPTENASVNAETQIYIEI